MKYLKKFEFYNTTNLMIGDYVIIDTQSIIILNNKIKNKIMDFCSNPGRIKSIDDTYVEIYWSNIPKNIQREFNMDDDGYGGSMKNIKKNEILVHSPYKKKLQYLLSTLKYNI